MIRARRVFTRVVSIFVAAVLLHGCATGKTARPKDPALRSVAGELSKLEGMVDYWGTASISEVLYMEDNGQFKLDYDQKVSDYVDKARAAYQGAARRFFQKAEETQTATTTEVDAVQAAKAALTGGPQGAAALDLAATAAGQLGVQGLGPDTAESYGIGEVMKSAPAIESKLKENTAKGVLNSDRFSDPYALADAPGGISERQALMIGANDKITENILKYLAHPTGLPENKIVLLGILQVSCNPGSGTREGYMADMLITPEYDRYETQAEADKKKAEADKKAQTDAKNAKGMLETEAVKPGGNEPDDDEDSGDDQSMASYYHKGIDARQPTVLAAFPLMEAQTLDLRNSEREQKALSAYVAALVRAQGQSQQNESLTTMAERLENDAATRSPVPTVVSYTNGDCVGFQFMPRFEALKSPEKKNVGSGKVLYPYSFPALVLLMMDKEDLLGLDPKDSRKTVIARNAIRLSVTTRWVPLESGKFGCKPTFDSNTRLAMAEKLERLTQTYNKLTLPQKEYADATYNNPAAGASTYHNPVSGPNYVMLELDRRMRVVEPRAMGKTVVSPMPMSIQTLLGKEAAKANDPNKAPLPSEPKITGLHADRGWLNEPTLVVVEGKNLTKDKVSLVKSVIVDGRACEYVPSGDATLLVIIPPFDGSNITCKDSKKPCVHKLTVVTTKGVDSADLKFSCMQSVAAGEDPAIKITRSAGGITGISVNQSGILDPGLIAIYRDILTGNGAVTLEGAKVTLEQR